MPGLSPTLKNPKWVLLGWYKDASQAIFTAVSREYDNVKEEIFGDTEVLSIDDFREILRGMFKPYPIADFRIQKTRENLAVQLEDKSMQWEMNR